MVWREILGYDVGGENYGFFGYPFSAVFVRNGSGTAQKRPRMPKRHKMVSKLHVGDNTFNFTLRMPIFDHDVGGENYGVTYAVFVWAT